MPPKRSAAAAIIASTGLSSATSTVKAKASPEQLRTVSSAAAPSMSATQTRAPSAVKTIAASRPMPPPAPVITHAFPSSWPATGRS